MPAFSRVYRERMMRLFWYGLAMGVVIGVMFSAALLAAESKDGTFKKNDRDERKGSDTHGDGE